MAIDQYIPTATPLKSGTILDIGGSKLENATHQALTNVLAKATTTGTPITLPDEMLYDSTGHELWSQIIYHPDYYQTRDEISLLDSNGDDIASYINPGAVMLDIGAGDTRKVAHLLRKIDARGIDATYVALDISEESLARNLKPLTQSLRHICCIGLWGSFSDGMAWFTRHDALVNILNPLANYTKHGTSSMAGAVAAARTSVTPEPPQRVLLSLGSVLCNDAWARAVSHLEAWARTLTEPDDFILAGMDGHDQLPAHREKLWAAYHFDADETEEGTMVASSSSSSFSSSDDLFSQFWCNGFTHANRLLGANVFRPEEWAVRGAVVPLMDIPRGLSGGACHRFIFTYTGVAAAAAAARHGDSAGLHLAAGQTMDWFDAHKYGPELVREMCGEAGLVVEREWKAGQDSCFYQYLFRSYGSGSARGNM
ncbi:hypothetical protein B0H63DRAFT_557112 [Podospora didyma]|uniref:Histidine-specific methyltransferase SAM-dependent domain-containing protein n=1 Tax=Podospora didyma TaxID=330526 RepID=A0AAE0NYQ9_9PEZI|nr:hypothetical protein B0H63DRAFT_557112 [Podospora didyma]